jgi:adenine-specific DNA glycosylase
MESNDIYEKIIELDGDCMKSEDRPPCQQCPFKKQCLVKMILLAQHIPKEIRVKWALDKLVEEVIFNGESEETND